MITTSMLVLLSSMDVGDDGDTRWSNNDLQSVANIGDLRLSTDRAWKGLNGPSMASARRRLSHSTVPPAVAIAWASPPRVEFTARGSLYDLHTAGVHGESLPACMSSCTNAMIKPAWVWEPTFAQAASEWAHKVSFEGSIDWNTIGKSRCCLALLIALLASLRFLTHGFGKHCWDKLVWTDKSGLDWLANQFKLPFIPRRTLTWASESFFSLATPLGITAGRSVSANCAWDILISKVLGSWE